MTPREKIEARSEAERRSGFSYLKDKLPGWEFLDAWEEQNERYHIAEDEEAKHPPTAWHIKLRSPTGKEYQLSRGEYYTFPGWEMTDWGLDGDYHGIDFEITDLVDAELYHACVPEDLRPLRLFLSVDSLNEETPKQQYLRGLISQYHTDFQVRSNRDWAHRFVGQRVTDIEVHNNYIVFRFEGVDESVRIERCPGYWDVQ